MRVLMTAAMDKTLLVAEVNEINYDPDEKKLYFYVNEGSYVASGVSDVTADNIIHLAYTDGRVDASGFEVGYADDEDEDGTEDDESAEGDY